MSDTRQSRVEEIFLSAVELGPGQKTQFLNQACGSDAELRHEVESLLGYHQDADGSAGGSSFLDSKASPGRGLLTQIGASALKGDEPLLPANRKLGQYTIRGVLGQGGMGVVYLAEQDRPKRTVALKVMRRGIGSEKLVRRFEFEAELLGRLQHPGIAQIYEAGTFREEGAGPGGGSPHPFIAMELVRGKPLIQHAEEARLSFRERLEILARVCDAVQHAHMSGVIHRDLKPANILMGEGGQPKILDFGVARVTNRDVSVTTIQTSVGQIIGTLPYMSPEQIAGDGGDVDTRSDVYALGVVAYELLTGRLPYQFKSHSLPEAARLIRDEPPIRMSTINRSLRGDVETIVNKALAKERLRRYQSAADLAADIRAYLEGRAIAAREDSAFYVLRKQLKRYKGVAAATFAAIVGLLTFAIYANIQANRNAELAQSQTREKRRAEIALAEANTQRERADGSAERLRRELTFANIERGRLLGLSGNMAAAEDLLWPEHLRNLDSYQSYYALWELYANTRCEATLPAHTNGRVWRLAASPDYKLLVTTALDPGVMVRDIQTFATVAQFDAGMGGVPIQGIAFAPDGLLALGNDRGRVAMFDPRSGREIIELLGAGPAVLDMTFDQSGQRLLISRFDGTIVLLDASRPTEAALSAEPLVGPPYHVLEERAVNPPPGKLVRCQGVARHPIRDEVALGGSDGKIRVIAFDGLAPIREIIDPDNSALRLTYSPDGSAIAVTGTIRMTRVYDSETGELRATLNAPNGTTSGVVFSPDGKQLFTGGWWYIQLWDVAQQKVIRSFPLKSAAGDMAVSPDGKHLWANLVTNIRAWELDPYAGQTRVEVTPYTRTLSVFNPQGGLIAGGADGSVSIVSDTDGAMVKQMHKGVRRMRAIRVSPQKTMALAVGLDGVLDLFDLEKQEQIGEWPGYKMITNDGIRFDSTGSRAVLSAVDDSFRVIAIPSGQVLLTIPKDGFEALGVAFSPDDRLIATTTRRNALCIYDAQTGEKLRECEKPLACPWTVAFTADGKHVLSGNWSRFIDVWDVETGALVRRLSGHRGLVADLHFRPHEPNILASAGTDGLILLWDLDLPQNTPILTLDGLEGWEVWMMDFDHTGRRLLGTNSRGLTTIWDLRYFNRHIGGNMGVHINALKASMGDQFDETAAREQEMLLLNRGKPSPAATPLQSPAPPPTPVPGPPAGLSSGS